MNLFAWVTGAFLLAQSAVAAPSWSADPLLPGSIPLAVRTPYMSAWLPQGGGNALNDVWPQFWNGTNLGWAGFVNVDGVAYSFLGAPGAQASFQKATQKSFKYTATQSIFVLSAGPVDLTATFLSPVEPDNFLIQSIPFSYMTISVASTDGGSHHVQVYSDISGEWVSGDPTLPINWNTHQLDQVIHEVQLANQQLYTEYYDHVQYGSAYFAIQNAGGVTFQTGADQDVRTQFVQNGVLNNQQDTQFRAINDNWPVFGLSKDLGQVGSSAASVTFAVGHVRDPAIEYIVAGGQTVNLSSYFWQNFTSPADVINFFFQSYSQSLSTATQFDAKVQQDASAISADYAAIVSLSIRQAFGATEITIGKDANDDFDPESILIFMKEISSDGNVNTVDVIFPAWPVFLYTNPAYGRYLLEPMAQYITTGQYPNPWCVHDMGGSYPRALGHNDGKDEEMPVEESGNVLIMALSYTQKSKDTSFITKYYKYLDQWAQFLIQDSLIPEDQISTDDFAGHLANQTNLAIKGIIGIQAMAEIASLIGDQAKAANYTSIVKSYVTQFQQFATASNGQHLTLSYGEDSTWGITYNLYGDKVLGLNVFPESLYELQTNWYKTVIEPYGIPLDTRNAFTKCDWEIFTAATVTDINLRNQMITAVKNYISSGQTDAPIPDLYEPSSGRSDAFRARPVVGGHLALLTL